MTLEQILAILDQNVLANGGNLVLTATTIASPEITEIFETYLLNGEMVVNNAVTALNPGVDVTVTGEGNSFILYKTLIDALTYTVDEEGVPSMSVEAIGQVADEDGWTLGASFPRLDYTNFGGYYGRERGTAEVSWFQDIFFEDKPVINLSETGLFFRGVLILRDNLAPLSLLFNGAGSVEVQTITGITIDTGSESYDADESTAVPVISMEADIGDLSVQVGDYTFTLTFTLNCEAYVDDSPESTGQPSPIIDLSINSTVPVNGVPVGIKAGFGIQPESLGLSTVNLDQVEIGLSELVALSNNENVIALLPSNLPLIDDFKLDKWDLLFDTESRILLSIYIGLSTRDTFSWDMIPGYFTLDKIAINLEVGYTDTQYDPALTLYGIVRIKDVIEFDLCGMYPSYICEGTLDLETPIDLLPILYALLPADQVDILPNTLQVVVLGVVIDPKNTTYLFTSYLITDLEILPTIILTTVAIDVSYVAGTPSGSISGTFTIGIDEDAPEMTMTAAYDGTNWAYSGYLEDGSEITLSYLIQTYFDSNAFSDTTDISITDLRLGFTEGENDAVTYDFQVGATWVVNLNSGGNFTLSAESQITYDNSAQPGSQYTGYISGMLDFGNIAIGVTADFTEPNSNTNYTFTFVFYDQIIEAKLFTDPDSGDTFLNFTTQGVTSLGDLIRFLVLRATGSNIILASPWNVMNDISLSDFELSFNLTKTTVTLLYNFQQSINLGFVDIEQMGLTYNYGDPENRTLILAISKGSFLGVNGAVPEPWDVLDPASTTNVPGMGTNVFRLDFLAMGQHVALASGQEPNSVSEAVDMMKAAFDSLEENENNPIQGTGLAFSSASNWMIGTQFILLDTISMGLVFFDSDLYGLSIKVNGAKAKIFDGLEFEALYKKVSGTIGVYQIKLQLPNSMRQYDFGSMAITLANLALDIYTNSDFKIDFGFPVKDDFSKSFSIQALPYTGAGGFYFASLSAQTADTVPDTTLGQFNPVITFGVGMQLGIGKDIDKGIMKAGLSLTIKGILEGTFAQYTAYADSSTDEYYWVQGKLALVGKVYGKIDFKIVTASLNLVVYVSTTMVFESYEPIYFEFTAGVSVTLKVKVNMGLVKVKIKLSYKTNITEKFSIGMWRSKPWELDTDNAYFLLTSTSLSDNGPVPVAVMDWQPLLPESPVDLAMYYLPQYSVANTLVEQNEVQKARAVAMLYLQSGEGVPEGEGVPQYPFDTFAEAVFLWVLGAFFNTTNQGIAEAEVLSSEISREDLEQIYAYFTQDNQSEPFTYDDIIAFLENYFNITVTVPDSQEELLVSMFPILPLLIFQTPSGPIYFDDDRAQYSYDETQLALVQEYFSQLDVDYQTGADMGGDDTVTPPPGTAEAQSLATWMLIDYLSLLAKEAVQNAIDTFDNNAYTVAASDTLASIAAQFNGLENRAAELAFYNRTRPLRAGTELTVNDTTHTATGEDSLLRVAKQYATDVKQLIRDNLETAGLYPEGSTYTVLGATTMLVSDLLSAMEARGDFVNLSGLSANIMLQGLRVPLPEENSTVGMPEALYVVTGQEVDASTLLAGDILSLQLEAPLGWLNLGTAGGVQVDYTLGEDDQTTLQEMESTPLDPEILELAALDLYAIQNKRYTLPKGINWEPAGELLLANGSNREDDPNTPTIWPFKSSLEALITGKNAIAPKVLLQYQVKDTVRGTGLTEPVTDYSWSTKIEMQIRQVTGNENTDETVPNVYEVQGIDQTGMALLENLITWYNDNEGTDVINRVDILYPKDPAVEGQDAPPTELISVSPSNLTTFLLQTNLSTLSNPTLAGTGGLSQEQEDMLGMDNFTFVQYLWEAAIVGTGGYYLYYKTEDTGEGLPDYLFSTDAEGAITLLITYDITDNILQSFLNSVVVKNPIDTSNEILYVETVPEGSSYDARLQTKVATVPSGNIGFSMERLSPENPDNKDTEIEKGLQELFNLLSYHIEDNADFNASVPGLPIGPSKTGEDDGDDLNKTVPLMVEGDNWDYARIVPLYPYAKTDSPLKKGVQKLLDLGPPLLSSATPAPGNDPYRAVGKSAQLGLEWNDIFGNQLPFDNTGGDGKPGASLGPITVGYIDPVTGVDTWSSVTSGYRIELDEQETPTLYITLAFNAANYDQLDPENKNWREKASADQEAYKQIFYQLVQEDMTVIVANAIDINSNYDNQGANKIKLVGFVDSIYQYLGNLLAGTVGIIPPDITIIQPVSDTNPSDLFALTTTLTLTRAIKLVDPDFRDVPEVVYATALIGADLSKTPKEQADVEATVNSITIQEFAQKLQSAFPELKVAAGQSSEAEDSADLWVGRFSANGINFSIGNIGNPYYFAIKPLSTSLLSKEKVPVYSYTTGTPIYENVPISTDYNGVDLERLAEDFLSAVDLFLKADYAVPAWIVENNFSPINPDGYRYPYQSVITSKKTLAADISAFLETVLDDAGTVMENNLEAARERLLQQLLITLSDAYSVDTVLQFDVAVNSDYQDAKIIAPNLFGKVFDTNGPASDTEKAYAFSTARFSLAQSGVGAGEQSLLTLLFNTKQEYVESEAGSYFPIDLEYSISSIEHEIEPVSGIEGYRSSEWLTFILPYDEAGTQLGSLKIPVPLRAYPTSPSLTDQTAIQELEGTETNDLQESKAWDYQYTYDYVRAQQDTINSDLLLNVDLSSLSQTGAEEGPDLFTALVQFSSAWPGILSDFNEFLLGQTDDSNYANAFTAMQSFAWVADRVATAWGTWDETGDAYADPASAEEHYQYRISESHDTAMDALKITVEAVDGATLEVPAVYIEDYLTEPAEPSGEDVKSYVYYNEEDGQKTYLSYADGQQISARSIGFAGFNIIVQQNAWAGLSITRNKNLVPGRVTNPEFIYQTPMVRFANPLTPLLATQQQIDMAEYTEAGQGIHTIETYLSNFFKALFLEIANQTTTRKMIVESAYRYNIQEGASGLQTVVPISMTTPFVFRIPEDWKDANCDSATIKPESPFVCQLATLLQGWFAKNTPQETDGQLWFDMSLFASDDETRVPVLGIRNIYLNINQVSNLLTTSS